MNNNPITFIDPWGLAFVVAQWAWGQERVYVRDLSDEVRAILDPGTRYIYMPVRIPTGTYQLVARTTLQRSLQGLANIVPFAGGYIIYTMQAYWNVVGGTSKQHISIGRIAWDLATGVVASGRVLRPAQATATNISYVSAFQGVMRTITVGSRDRHMFMLFGTSPFVLTGTDRQHLIRMEEHAHEFFEDRINYFGILECETLSLFDKWHLVAATVGDEARRLEALRLANIRYGQAIRDWTNIMNRARTEADRKFISENFLQPLIEARDAHFSVINDMQRFDRFNRAFTNHMLEIMN